MGKVTARGFTFMGLRVRDDVREKLEECARREEVSLTQIFRWAIKEYLERQSSISSDERTRL